MRFANFSILVPMVQADQCREALAEHLIRKPLSSLSVMTEQNSSISSVVNLTYFMGTELCLK